MDNEDLAMLAPITRLLFIYLWMLADKEGRLEDRPARIKKQALGYDDFDCNATLEDLSKSGFITRYEVKNIKLIQIVNFKKHQSPHVREQESCLPGVEQVTTEVVTKHDLGSDKTSPRSPDSLFSDSLIPDSISREPTASAAPSPAQSVIVDDDTDKKKSQRGTRLPDDWTLPADWKVWALGDQPSWDEDYCERIAAQFRDYWIAVPGTKGCKLNWESTWRNWVRREKPKPYSGGSPKNPQKPYSEIDYTYGVNPDGSL